MDIRKARKNAREVAVLMHKGQVDKAGIDYVEGHLDSVAAMAQTPQEIVVAYLHDVAEDTPNSEAEALLMLRERLPMTDQDFNTMLEALTVLNHNRFYTREEYIEAISRNPLARRVKMLDLTNNMDLSRLPNPSPKDEARVERYRKEYEFLESKEKNMPTHTKMPKTI